ICIIINVCCRQGNKYYISPLTPGRADVRLVNGASPCEGTVEVYHDGEWGTIMDLSWDLDVAEVLCRQLGCGSAVSAPVGAHFGPGSGSVLLGGVSCSGSESALRDCGKTEVKQYGFPHDFDAGVRCSVRVRLAGGRSLCSGRVEVLRGTSWDTICEADFDMKDAEVVCRQLDCGFPAELLRGAYFGEGQGLIRTEEIQCRGNETRIHDCPTSTREHQSCAHSNDISLVCTEYSGYRLVDGPDSCSGRVELQYRGEYRTVCDQYWDLRDATVLCQQLGCGEAVAAPGQAWFGQGSGSRGVDVFECLGNETRLSHCAVSSWGRAACSQGQDAGVICSSIQCSGDETHLVNCSSPQTVSCSAGQEVSLLCSGSSGVRLVNGASPCEGTVEIQYKGEWGTVFQANWDLDDAAVVCRQLGCGSAVSAPGGAHFGPGSGSVLLGDVSCRGSEAALRDCGKTEVKHYPLPRDSDAGVRCSAHRGVRLVGGSDICSGRVELQHGETWGSVCDSDFGWQDAEVVCRELDCGVPSQVLKGAHFGKGEGQVWTEELQCQGNESQIFSCPKSSTTSQNCTHENNVGLVCFGYTGFRLVNGSDSCSGRVELQWLFKDWGTVCDLYWDLTDASVLCQQLGCGEAVAAPGQAWFGQGSGPVWADVFECRGNESRLSHCTVSSWGRAGCSHGQDAGVICSGFPSSSVPSSVTPAQRSLRLVGAGSDCAGRLEVYHNGSWGTVCDDSWGLADSQVVCKQLQCGTALSAPVPASFSQGTGTIWLNKVGCLGNESSLWECPSAGWGQHDCGHKEDVGVVCSGWGSQSHPVTTGSTRTTPQTQQLGGLSISLPVLLPLGALLFVVLALLVWQLIHNRKLRK
uniref:SRCR domain-containing protein n=1 Tax=Lepisosteus oculatus TaxID=7918 RepID=W5LVI3_LEPOC